MTILAGVKSGKEVQAVLCWRRQICPRLRIVPAAPTWTLHRSVTVSPSLGLSKEPRKVMAYVGSLFWNQSSDSTHIDDSQLQMSPVFPLTGCRAEVHLNRLDLDVVETCRSSGFVLCSQDSSGLTPNSAQPRSPVFPQSSRISCPTSPVFPGDDEGHEGQPAQSPTLCETSPSNRPACEDAEFGFFSSQESLIPTLRSSPPQSPVFPKSPSECKDSAKGQVERRAERSVSPALGLTDPQDQPGSDQKVSCFYISSSLQKNIFTGRKRRTERVPKL